ncbi:unnamed protein product [Protopolystoma xenopodis]|uniref:Uncharacterized protein n=1 Tax=Protopolystoma xenopodis TaxID=117903 RepID=A0A3S5ADB3_9PLAT|nr:unnamed protein product [Protopolystoma xenopodis]
MPRVRVLRCIRPLTRDRLVTGQYVGDPMASGSSNSFGYLDDSSVPKEATFAIVRRPTVGPSSDHVMTCRRGKHFSWFGSCRPVKITLNLISLAVPQICTAFVTWSAFTQYQLSP